MRPNRPDQPSPRRVRAGQLAGAVAWAVAMALVAVSAAAETLGPAPAGSFSVVVIPDTQMYRGQGTKAQPDSTDPISNDDLAQRVKWIVDNLDAQRVAFVSHVGDLVDRDVPEQWAVARQLMQPLHGRIPYGISVGNHDMKASGRKELFQQHFPAARFDGMAWYGGCYAGTPQTPQLANNANSFQLFSAAGMDFVIVHLECNAPDEVLAWADSVLDRHSQRRAMITTHMGLGPIEKPKTNEEYFTLPRGRMQWKKDHGKQGNTPQQMWEKCFRKHANLFVVFSGDQGRPQALRLDSRNQHGGTLYELMSDYDARMVRVNRFLPGENRIEVFTVDSHDGSLCTGTPQQRDPAQHRFTLEYAMSPGPLKP